MGKNRTQKPSVMREAANKRAEYRKWLVRLVVGLVICLAAIGAYYLLVTNEDVVEFLKTNGRDNPRA